MPLSSNRRECAMTNPCYLHCVELCNFPRSRPSQRESRWSVWQ